MMKNLLRNFAVNVEGATAIEYGLIAALVALVGVVGFTALGDTIAKAYSDIASQLCNSVNGTWTAGADGGGSCA
jgi:pilus assembly protein Flp/PilA